MHRHKNTLTGMHTLWILNRNLVPYTCTRWARVQSNTKGLFLAWDGSIWHTPESEPWHMFLHAHLDRVSIRRPECERASYICSTVRRWIVLSCICLSVHVHELAMLNQYACLCDWVHGWVWKDISPNSMESTEVQADPVSHKIHLPRAMLTSLSLPCSLTLSVPLPSSPQCLWLKLWARLQTVHWLTANNTSVYICCCMHPHGSVYSRLMSLDSFSSLCLP